SLLIVLAVDTLLVAALWTALVAIWQQCSEDRPRPAALVAIITLTVSIVLLGLAPGIVTADLDLRA
ncbi:MAG: hypothetical protein GWN58_00505, partial [Anaerolineae bacterium]|nr:hypothetical protein [Anaerolineae bacterium]